MKIAAIYFDDMVVVPGGRDLGGGLAQGDERASSFVATEGWDIRETLPGVFSLLREGMAEPVTIGGYGYSYVKAPTPETLPKGLPCAGTRNGKRCKSRGAYIGTPGGPYCGDPECTPRSRKEIE